MPPPVRRKRTPHNSACSHFIGTTFAESANGPQPTLGSDTELLSLVSSTFQEVDTVDSNPDNDDLFKLDEIDYNDWPPDEMHALRDTYHTVFHPDPDIHIPGSIPVDSRLYANTRLADWSTLLSAPFGNCSATYVILNSAQHVALHDLIANVEDIPHLAYLIPTALPSVIN